ncbi:MAG: hypothetical protein KGP12_09090 [Actinomycetales bacterium]|nr:hypothetical protein [Actinomycetales bacterium]
MAIAMAIVAGSATASAATGFPVEFPLVEGSTPVAIAAGPDGNSWTADGASNTISRVGPAGATAAFIVPTPGSMPAGIAAGPDGAMWFTGRAANRIARITMTGAITEFALPAAGAAPTGITAGADGRMYAAAVGGIVTVAMDGSIGLVGLPPGSRPEQVALIDGQVWYASPDTDEVGRVSGGTVQSTRLASGGRPYGIAQAPGGGAWVTLPGGNALLRLGADLQPVGRFQIHSGQALPVAVQTGADGNAWVTLAGIGSLARVTSGVVPESTSPPTVIVASAPGRPAVSELGALVPGMILAADPGAWSYIPVGYMYEWQRCASEDVASCRRVADPSGPVGVTGAAGSSYAVSTADLGLRLRIVVRAASLAGPGGAAASSLSPPVAIGPAAGSIRPLSARAEIGGQVSAILLGPADHPRGRPGRYRVAFTSPRALGTVAFRWRNGDRQAVVENVLVVSGRAACTWTPPSNWPGGRTTVTADFRPAAGTAFTAARMRRTLSIR